MDHLFLAPIASSFKPCSRGPRAVQECPQAKIDIYVFGDIDSGEDLLWALWCLGCLKGVMNTRLIDVTTPTGPQQKFEEPPRSHRRDHLSTEQPYGAGPEAAETGPKRTGEDRLDMVPERLSFRAALGAVSRSSPIGLFG